MNNTALLQSALQVIDQYASAHQQLLILMTSGQNKGAEAVLTLLEHASTQRERLLAKVLLLPQDQEDDLAQAKAHIDLLTGVCAEAYQMAGALDASIPALDNLLAAANGETKLPHDSFLPHPCNEEFEQLKVRVPMLERALSFYANGEHYALIGDGWQRNVPGDAPNWFYNTSVEDGDELVEDGSIAKQALQQSVDETRTADMPNTDG